jgi:two-component system, NtrC family, nitrogen regulation response regulator GlnG
MRQASPTHILIIDDEEAVCWALQRALTKRGHTAAVAPSAELAFESIEQKTPDAILLDVRLPGMDGLTALGRLRAESRDAPVIVMTAHGNLSTAVRAMDGGAFDYLAKPFDLDQALTAVERALQRRKQPSVPAEKEDTDAVEPEEIVGRSPAMQAVFKRIALVAPRDSSVLITGESGTGKELVAHAIHRYSARQDRPFLPVHIASLNPNLVESELFGHVKGAFTGATQNRPGLLALADGGTVFLDELADIPLSVQVKLLRVLEQGEVLPVGSVQAQKLDIRILGATHQDLTRQVAAGHFRQDLLFRLNVFQIHLPPLREHSEDIQPLAEHFLRRIAPQLLPLSAETRQRLSSLPWFGNVRELRNALEHAAILARSGPLLAEHLPTLAAAPPGTTPEDRLAEAVRTWVAQRVQHAGAAAPTELHPDLLREVEKVLIEEIAKRVHGNRWEAARWLGLNRTTVRKKLAEYGLSDIHREDGSDDPE